jgi:hypothetical protein
MDQATDDWNDASWHQAEQDERSAREQQMLTDDPGYLVFLLSYEEVHVSHTN